MFKLPPLPYDYDALEPYIDEETMHLHHDKHHKGYVDKLNEALKDYSQYYEYSSNTLVANWKKLPRAIQESVRNQGGGDVNHTMFWVIMKKNNGLPSPIGELASQINKDFGSFEKFKTKFSKVTEKLFGSGWTWLTFVDNKLKIFNLPNQDCPLTMGDYPIMGFDNWEHSYYISYRNDKSAYLKAWWNVLNWPEINKRFIKAKSVASKKPKTKNQFSI